MSARFRDAHLPEADRALLDIASTVEPFSSPLGQPFFALPLAFGTRQVFPIHSGLLRDWLLARYYDRFGEPPPDQSLRRAVRTLQARALCAGQREQVLPRIAWLNGNPAAATVLLNLGNSGGEFVTIDREGWQIVGDLPYCFAWRRGNLPLPSPIQPSGPAPLPRLRSWLHCGDPSWLRCLLWLAAALSPTGPYPVLILQGPPASGKSTAARILRTLIDPSSAPLLTLPGSRREILALAARAWILAFDHVAEIPGLVSDALCRVSTGAEFQIHDRNDPRESFLTQLQRPILITAPPGLRLRPDLAARSLIAEFPAIPPEFRRTETALRHEFETAAPSILGALCTAVRTALERLPDVSLPNAPPYADAAAWALAAAPALGVSGQQLISAFHPAAPDPLVRALCTFMLHRSEWRGSAAALLAALRPCLGDSAPATPKGISQQLRRSASSLSGLVIEFDRRHGSRQLLVTHRASAEGQDAAPDSLSPKEPGT